MPLARQMALTMRFFFVLSSLPETVDLGEGAVLGIANGVAEHEDRRDVAAVVRERVPREAELGERLSPCAASLAPAPPCSRMPCTRCRSSSPCPPRGRAT